MLNLSPITPSAVSLCLYDSGAAKSVYSGAAVLFICQASPHSPPITLGSLVSSAVANVCKTGTRTRSSDNRVSRNIHARYPKSFNFSTKIFSTFTAYHFL